jgi:hypothetical protein
VLRNAQYQMYISVEPFHLERYIDERSYRFNNRAIKDNPLTDLDKASSDG